MPNIITLEKLPLKNHPTVKEDLIQKFIFENPSVLGLGELTPVQREKTQPAGGRLDLLLADDDNTRYEVEIQLGATDPSHIIRTIEYWDSEKKRYPQYDHCAVIVAEEITGRFMNVISLFNGAIPLIALQLSAYKHGDDISLTFTKVLDRVTYATDDEERFEVTDRNYWENKSTSKVLKSVDNIFECVKEYISGYELNYNKFYIGMVKDGITKNFLWFKPKKNFLCLFVKCSEDSELITQCENEGLDITYKPRYRECRVRLADFNDYKKHKEVIDALIKNSMDIMNI